MKVITPEGKVTLTLTDAQFGVLMSALAVSVIGGKNKINFDVLKDDECSTAVADIVALSASLIEQLAKNIGITSQELLGQHTGDKTQTVAELTARAKKLEKMPQTEKVTAELTEIKECLQKLS